MPRKIKHITRSMKGFRGKFPSTKPLAVLPTRSILEFDSLKLLEFSPGVRWYRSFHEAVAFHDGERESVCFPDYIAGLSDGTEVLVEIHESVEFEEEQIKRRYDGIAAAVERSGRRYRLLTEEDIHRQPRCASLQRFMTHRMKLGAEERQGATEWLRAACPLSFGEVQRHFGDIRMPLRLLADCVLRCDLELPVLADTTLDLVTADDALLLF